MTNWRLIDLTNQDIEVHISDCGTKLWVNGREGCFLRAYGIPNLEVNDYRKVKPELAGDH